MQNINNSRLRSSFWGEFYFRKGLFFIALICLVFFVFNSQSANSHFDGDGKSDYVVWRPSNGDWSIIKSSDNSTITTHWGQTGDVPISGDFDGDGKSDYVVWRPSNGVWYMTTSSDNAYTYKTLGQAGDVPVSADFDGDGKSDYVVWRPSNGDWSIIKSSDNSTITTHWGQTGDVPISGDFDGDGKSDYVVWRPSNGVWYMTTSSDNAYTYKTLGQAGDVPVSADFDGDGKSDYVVWRPSNGDWSIIKSSDNSTITTHWGQTGDVPISGDFDGDGKSDYVVWRPSNGVWYMTTSSDNAYTYKTLGQAGDVPMSFIKLNKKNNKNNIATVKPTLSKIYPQSALTGEPDLWITALGSDFSTGRQSTVFTWDGSPRETKIISPTQLRAKILVSDITSSGTHTIQLRNSTEISTADMKFTVNQAPTTPACNSSQNLYVSPSGDDTNSGSIVRPFKTLGKARDTVRSLNAKMTSCITINLRGGTYNLQTPFNLDQRDSGTNGYYIKYKNYPGETPLIIGGKMVTGWSQVSGTQIWKANVGIGIQSRQFYVDNLRATRARSDSSLTLTETENYKTRNFDTGKYKTVTTNIDISSWKNPQDMEVASNIAWRNIRCGVQGISGKNITLKMDYEGCAYTRALLLDHTGAETPDSWLENAYELLDKPGEWYLNKATGWLYYYPRTGEKMNSVTAVLPTLESLVNIQGTPQTPVNNISFEGINFAYSTWLKPSTYGFYEGQANFSTIANGRTPGAINVQWARSVVFEKNIFAHLGAIALDIQHVQNSIVRGNHIYDISGSGVQIGEATVSTDAPAITRNNIVADNVIHDIGQEFYGGVGIWNGLTQDDWIFHNELYNLPYSGISIGWSWTDDITQAQDNRVEANFVHDNMRVLKDGGGIYSNGAQPGNIYSDNVIKNQVHEFGALYFDSGSRYLSAYNNVLFNNLRTAILTGENDLHDNWWQDRGIIDKYSDIWIFPPSGNAKPSTFQNNTTITSLSQAPSSIVSHAGLESSYVSIKSGFVPIPTKNAPSSITMLLRNIASSYSSLEGSVANVFISIRQWLLGQ